MHFSHCYLQHNSKMNDPSVLEVGTGISYKWYGFWVEGLGLTAIRRGFELHECLLVAFSIFALQVLIIIIITLTVIMIGLFITLYGPFQRQRNRGGQRKMS